MKMNQFYSTKEREMNQASGLYSLWYSHQPLAQRTELLSLAYALQRRHPAILPTKRKSQTAIWSRYPVTKAQRLNPVPPIAINF
jgi:hypothetical protein